MNKSNTTLKNWIILSLPPFVLTGMYVVSDFLFIDETGRLRAFIFLVAMIVSLAV